MLDTAAGAVAGVEGTVGRLNGAKEWLLAEF